MIPNFNRKGYLPAGVHQATLKEIDKRFGEGSTKRTELFNKLKIVLNNLKSAGVEKVFINGSYVTSKIEPNDIDGCWEANPQVNPKKLDPVLLDFGNNRQKMKKKYEVDFFIAEVIEQSSGYPFKEFFQRDRDGKEKGIILIKL